MTLDPSTRNRLQKTVTACRRLLTADFNLQLQRDYGIYADEGKVFPLEKLVSQDDRTLHTGRLLRERIDHLKASEPEAGEPLKLAVDRVLREQAFTVVNRFAALRMAEERGLIQLSVGKGFQSDAFLVFDNFAGAAVGTQYDRYRLFFSCLVDELSLDLGVLFDRHSPYGLLFPSADAIGRLFDELNAPDIQPLWKADETIGWIYQYYNDETERKKMREASAAPRSSRELAVRNQFFTPRYVVEFLIDNTLGRIWYEMRKGKTSLKGQCSYLVSQPNEIFLNESQNLPEGNQQQDADENEMPQKELLKHPIYIPHRALKDPREIRVLDPACGSMHFGLYAFDLFEIIYREAWDLPDLRQQLAEAYGHASLGEVIAAPESVSLRSQSKVRCFASGREVGVEEAILVLARYEEGRIAGRPLIYHPEEVASRRKAISQEIPLGAFKYDRAVQQNWFSPVTGRIFLENAGCFDFQTQPAKTIEEAFLAFQRDIPRLIIERNLHGIDIDPRCAQIAGLSLWLRAQKSWQNMKLRPIERPMVRKSNIVCAEPMPGEKDLLREFVEQLFPAGERPIFTYLLETVFDRMALAGEAGSLLRIEEEIRNAIAQAKKLWKEGPKHEQGALFESGTAPDQDEMPLDLSGITDEQFWERAEQQIYDSLEAYAEQAENGGGFQRRLFADDAARGFAFIDLCRKRYDVVVMNPPFGEGTKASKEYLVSHYPITKNDVYAAFVERWLGKLHAAGRLGAITSRSGFFLKTFQKWREEVLMSKARPAVLADLGYGVLDAAMVETAAYVLGSTESEEELICVRLNAHENKGESLRSVVSTLAAGGSSDVVFRVAKESLALVPGSPFAYWIDDKVRRIFGALKPLESEGRDVQSGASTMDDFRFLRLSWEVHGALQARSRKQTLEGKCWVPLVKGGPFSRYYIDWELVVDWANDGHCLKTHVSNYRGKKGWGYHWAAAINGHNEYFRPGLTWPRRTQGGLNVRILPAGSIFGDKGPAIFVPANSPKQLAQLLAVTNSESFRALVSLQMAFGSYEVGVLERTPVPNLTSALNEELAEYGIHAWSEKRMLDTAQLTSHAFVIPALIASTGEGVAQRITAWAARVKTTESTLGEIQSTIDDLVARLYGISSQDRVALAAITSSTPVPSEESCETEQEVDGDSSDTDAIALTADVISYMLGCIFGRWDIRYATGERPAPALPSPFAPLPVCPPGMLQDIEGLPLGKEEIGKMREEKEYPIDVVWDGILVDDPEHPLDLVTRLQATLAVIWGNRADAVEHEICEILGVRSLREWFRRSVGFFADHLKRYSKSRRQAPIYWPLSTASGGYTLWLYYHRLDGETLFQCVNRYIEPKLAALEKDLTRLRKETEEKKTRDDIEKTDTLRLELEEMKAEMVRIAALPWTPNLNDGVLITASPLWQLFRLPKWQKDLKTCWQKLERGDYDWAHLANVMWPERVKKACENDRSIAIAHGLEHLCKVEAPKPKKKRGKISAPEGFDEAE